MLRAEGLRVGLVNSNPATIMTDPEFADATYVEPITPEFVEKVIAKERPDALLATLGGQTALNTAVALHEAGVLERYGVELIGANVDAIQRRRGPPAVQGDRAPTIGARVRAQSERGLPHAWTTVRGRRRRARLPGGGPARRSRWAAPARASPRRGRAATGWPAPAWPPVPMHEVLLEESILGWKEYELELMRDRARQRRRRLLDREPRPDGRAHRRLDHRRAGDDADRPRVPAHARHRASP